MLYKVVYEYTIPGIKEPFIRKEPTEEESEDSAKEKALQKARDEHPNGINILSCTVSNWFL